jgi:hypothetical protein
LELDQVEEVV